MTRLPRPPGGKLFLGFSGFSVELSPRGLKDWWDPMW